MTQSTHLYIPTRLVFGSHD